MRFLDSCRKQPTDRTPIWMMRQAGRTLPSYRALREHHTFLDVIKEPELMARISLMPLEEMPLDAAVIFADIMLPLTALGIEFDIVESIGPVVADPIRSIEQVRALTRRPVADAVPSVPAAIRIVRAELDGRVPVIGFSGAPFTLASYVIEGQPTRGFAKTKTLMFGEPATWHALMETLTSLIIEYLSEQVAAGAQALQLFDSWIGALSPDDVRSAVLPYSARIFSALRALDVPLISFGTGTAGLLELMAEADPDVVSVDWRVRLDEGWARIGDRAIQGNLDPAVLLGPPELVRSRALEVLNQAHARPGHIFNLGHGVLPDSPLDNLKLLVDTVHDYEAA